MKSKIGRLSVLATLVAALGLMAAFAASASADSITCEISGSIKLSPGLSETPTQQNIGITKHKGALLSNCTGAVETTVTGGSVHVVGKTTGLVTCKTLTEAGAPVEEAAIFKWQPKGEGTENSNASFVMPLTEMPVAIEGTFAAEAGHPFSEDKISGTVTQKYGATCGSSGKGKGGGKKDNKGTFKGSITLSE